jgi:ABC-type branched-subunit amino acid transport system permease subunit
VQSLVGAGLVIFLLDVKPALDQKPATGTSNGPQLLLGLLVVLLVRWEPGGLAAAARRVVAWTTTKAKAQRREAVTSA